MNEVEPNNGRQLSASRSAARQASGSPAASLRDTNLEFTLARHLAHPAGELPQRAAISRSLCVNFGGSRSPRPSAEIIYEEIWRPSATGGFDPAAGTFRARSN